MRRSDMSEYTAEEARRRWDYDSGTGLLRWKVRASNRVKIGDVTGNRNTGGHIQVKWGHKYVYAHRLIWLIVHGEWPLGEIDHINGVRDDNRLVNLRSVTRHENCQNMACHRNGHLPGTSRMKQDLKAPWRAYIMIDRKWKHLGMFATQEEAHARYMQELKRANVS